ncbi:hypothetical protein QVD17_27122 [Tagetes erecta]|uniref:Uncharacterized protein n=1 Tax=Tagetes erecta TaxID=13708 RepID=A0AAD8KBC3_TARER|nr:hypothetical protein QVD17_27122 [Tagetes erecta]
MTLNSYMFYTPLFKKDRNMLLFLKNINHKHDSYSAVASNKNQLPVPSTKPKCHRDNKYKTLKKLVSS